MLADYQMIYQRVRKRVTGISRDTVYRTLATLENEGLIRKAEVLGGPARFDANLDQHHHFVCAACGAVKDFRSRALDDLPIPDAVHSNILRMVFTASGITVYRPFCILSHARVRRVKGTPFVHACFRFWPHACVSAWLLRSLSAFAR